MKKAQLLDIPMNEYHDDKHFPKASLSSSMVKTLHESSPAAALLSSRRLNPNFEEDKKGHFDIGTVAHTLFVGGDDEIDVLDYDSFRTTAAKEARDNAYACDRTPILSKDYEPIQMMAEIAKHDFSMKDEIRDLLDLSQPEQSVYWTEPTKTYGDVYCRARPDFYVPDDLQPIIMHYKTTGQNITARNLSRIACNLNWDLMQAHYEMALRALHGDDVQPRQILLVQEYKAPHSCAICELDGQFMDYARERHQRLFDLWAKCVNNDHWPRLDTTRTMFIECPPWRESDLIV